MCQSQLDLNPFCQEYLLLSRFYSVSNVHGAWLIIDVLVVDLLMIWLRCKSRLAPPHEREACACTALLVTRGQARTVCVPWRSTGTPTHAMRRGTRAC
jgi:hypothetical protein